MRRRACTRDSLAPQSALVQVLAARLVGNLRFAPTVCFGARHRKIQPYMVVGQLGNGNSFAQNAVGSHSLLCVVVCAQLEVADACVQTW